MYINNQFQKLQDALTYLSSEKSRMFYSYQLDKH